MIAYIKSTEGWTPFTIPPWKEAEPTRELMSEPMCIPYDLQAKDTRVFESHFSDDP